MKKFFSLMAIAIASLSFVSCSDKDVEAILSVDPSFSDGLVADLDGGFYKIPITADQAWTARLDDGCDWATLLDVKGDASGSIEVCVDANYTGTGRKTNVLISSGDKVVAVPISQRTPDTNENTTEEEFYNIASNKGLGFGLDLSTFSNGNTMVFNLKAIEQLMKEDEIEYAGMFTSDVISKFHADDIHVDSIEKKADTLGIELRFNINYGLFHLGVKASYEGTEERKTYSNRYKVVQSVPKLNAHIGYNEILSKYRDWEAEGRKITVGNDQKKDYRGCLLQKNVAVRLDTLELSKDSANIKKAAQWMYSNLGPALIIGTTLGGSVAMQLYVDSIRNKDFINLDTASIDVAFKSGLFSLDADVNVQYKKKAEEFLQHTDCNANIRGGDVKCSEDLYNAFKAKQYEKLDTLFRKWTNSLVLSNTKTKNTTSIIAIDVVPVWVLVDEYSPARTYLRNFVLQQVKAVGNRQLIDKFDEYPY